MTATISKPNLPQDARLLGTASEGGGFSNRRICKAIKRQLSAVYRVLCGVLIRLETRFLTPMEVLS